MQGLIGLYYFCFKPFTPSSLRFDYLGAGLRCFMSLVMLMVMQSAIIMVPDSFSAGLQGCRHDDDDDDGESMSVGCCFFFMGDTMTLSTTRLL